MTKLTTIRIQKKNALGLIKLKEDINETYDDVIVRLIDFMIAYGDIPDKHR